MPARDTIGIVETCYDLSIDSQGFNGALIDVAEGLLPSHTGLAAYSMLRGPSGEVLLRNLVSRDVTVVAAFCKAWGIAERGGGDLEVTRVAARQIFLRHWHLLTELLLGSAAMGRLPLKAACLDFPDTRDIIVVSSQAHLGEEPGVVLAGGRNRIAALSPAESARWLRIRAHLSAGVRLRWRFERRALSLREPVDDGAVLEPGGRVVHAHGEASTLTARESLQRAAIDVDRARTRAYRSDEGLELWKGLVRGEWSLVERFDADGRRFYVAHKNSESLSDPRGLSAQEARVAALAARGFANKLIAYYLGLSVPTVASHLRTAQRKLGCDSRAALIRSLGPSYPTYHRSGLVQRLVFKPSSERVHEPADEQE